MSWKWEVFANAVFLLMITLMTLWIILVMSGVIPPKIPFLYSL